MATDLVVLGGGTAGTLVANRLSRVLPAGQHRVTVVDRDDVHIYQPGLLFVPFGLAPPGRLTRSRRLQLRPGIAFVEDSVASVDLDADVVHLAGGRALHYDVLVVATGAVLLPGDTEGLAESLGTSVHTFYDLESAAALAAALARFDGGRLVVNVVDLPVKCPVAPLEFCFLADWYFTERQVRERVDISYVTPLDGAFTKPVASARLGRLLADKRIALVTEFNTGTVEPGRLVSYDDREVPFDLAVVVPLHGGASFVSRSPGLGDELGFVTVDPASLQHTSSRNVFALGDAAAVPTSKAGSVAHFEGEVLVENVRRFLAGEELAATFDGHTNCFIETGFHKALLIDFNYETEPLPGSFPGALGLPLLKESRLNHLGKRMFEPFYWHGLLPGRDLPGIGSPMPEGGKRHPVAS